MSKTRGNRRLVAFSVFVLAAIALPLGAEEWTPLFDGKTLDGWEVFEDKGNFFVEDGMIVGETSAGVRRSYLCTKEKFDNFVLEVEFKVDKGLNSGVQIRSGIYDEQATTLYMTGRLDLRGRCLALRPSSLSVLETHWSGI